MRFCAVRAHELCPIVPGDMTVFETVHTPGFVLAAELSFLVESAIEDLGFYGAFGLICLSEPDPDRGVCSSLLERVGAYPLDKKWGRLQRVGIHSFQH